MIYIIPTDTCFWIACSFDDTQNYHRIYEIKKRPLEKPLAIMVESFEWLEQNTELNNQQIDFLKTYNKPFTILTECPYIKMILNLEQEDFEYQNKESYKKIAFRVAHNDIQKKLLSEIGPIFLTSANFSWEKEIYDISEAKKQFQNFKNIQFLWEWIVLDNSIKPSDIFEFEWESTNITYLRQ